MWRVAARGAHAGSLKRAGRAAAAAVCARTAAHSTRALRNARRPGSSHRFSGETGSVAPRVPAREPRTSKSGAAASRDALLVTLRVGGRLRRLLRGTQALALQHRLADLRGQVLV